MTRPLTLRLLAGRFAIARLEPAAGVPDWITGAVTSVTRTPHELSIVCAEAAVPATVRSSAGWSCLEVAGPLDFSETGILSTLTAALAEAGVSVFSLSTFDTDYLLVRTETLEPAVAALDRAGHRVERRALE